MKKIKVTDMTPITITSGFSNTPTNVELWHPINGKWFHIFQIIDTKKNKITYFTNGVKENK
jgi:hypothetical protein